MGVCVFSGVLCWHALSLPFTELIALLKAKISKKHFREGETCPSSEILDIESDTFGIFLYPSNENDEEQQSSDQNNDDEVNNEDTESNPDDTEDEQDDTVEPESSDGNNEEEDDNEDTESNPDDTEDEQDNTVEPESSDGNNEEEDDNEDTESNPDDTEDEQDDTVEPEGSDNNNEEEDDNEDTDGNFDDTEDYGNADKHHKGTGQHGRTNTKRSGPAKKSLKAGEYEELINLIRRNIRRETFIKRSKRSVKANEYPSARELNHARTEVQCSHVIKTTQKVVSI